MTTLVDEPLEPSARGPFKHIKRWMGIFSTGTGLLKYPLDIESLA